MLFLQLPSRVSRLYPVFSLILAITSSILFYAWQADQTTLNQLSNVQQRDELLHNQIDQLTTTQKFDKARLQVQNQKIQDATVQLTQIQQQLATSNAQLAAKEEALNKAQQQLKTQQDQLSTNASEIDQLRTRPPLFSFQNQSSLADVSQKESDVKNLVTTAYTYIQQLYGPPYLLNSIVINFVNEFKIPGAAGEIIIENSAQGIKVTIDLKDFDKTNFQDINTVIHEIIHGFHGVAVLETSALEEGMTVAATDAVMQKMMDDSKIPHFSHLYLTTNDAQYASWNTSIRIPLDNKAFYSSPDISQVYQVIGTAWYRLYQQDPNFFKELNAGYYAKTQKGVLPDNALILDQIRSIVKTVNGQTINDYLSSNHAFNPS